MTRERTTRSARPSAMVKWNDELRTVLYLLNEKTSCGPQIRTIAFNQIFSDYLRSCGKPEGVSDRVLSSQYGERTKESAAGIWSRISDAPTTEAQKRGRGRLMERVESALASLGHQVTAESIEVTRSLMTTLPSFDPTKTPPPAFRHAPVTPTTPRQQIQPSTPRTPPQLPTPSSEAARSSFSYSRKRYVAKSSPSKRKHSSIEQSSPSAIVSIPFEENFRVAIQSNMTATRSPKKLAPEKRIYKHPSGRQLMLPEKSYNEMIPPFVPITAAQAHPYASGLLYRYWDVESAGFNSDTGFKAGKFLFSEISLSDYGTNPHPPSTKVDWTDLESHVNKRKNNASPYISTTNSLCWILRMAAKTTQKHGRNLRITVIDQSHLDPAAVYHAAPYVAELRRKKLLDNDKMWYHGTHEFFVHHSIPAKAVIHTFTLRDFFSLVATDAALTSALHPQDLSLAGGFRARLHANWKAHNTRLTDDVTAGLAKLVVLLGLNTQSPVEHISHIISDTVEQWGFHIRPATPEEWLNKATIFWQTFWTQSGGGRVATLAEQQKVKLGFLDGVRWGLGKYNCRHTKVEMDKMMRKARLVGLDDLETILAFELDAAKLHVGIFRKRHQMIVAGPSRGLARLAITDGGEEELGGCIVIGGVDVTDGDEEEEDDGVVVVEDYVYDDFVDIDDFIQYGH